MSLTYCQTLQALDCNRPLIHCISNQIASHFQANALLAIGCSPIMTDEADGAEEIAKQAQALLVNLGSPLTASKLTAIEQALAVSQDRQTPRVLDPVGIASIGYRYQLVNRLLAQYKFTAIRGNYAEICRLQQSSFTVKGVDSITTPEDMGQVCFQVARKFQTLVIATGPRDYLSDGEQIYYHDYGHPLLSQITGTGCVASTILTAFLSHQSSLENAGQALAFYGWSGEKAANAVAGPGYLENELINQLYQQRICARICSDKPALILHQVNA